MWTDKLQIQKKNGKKAFTEGIGKEDYGKEQKLTFS